ncbi:MAG: magnesium transporter MgtE [Gammaproteobacteria bacterium]|nr:MAG: magnesium transporter MgtE [Gammaproteobacteria bacterium]
MTDAARDEIVAFEDELYTLLEEERLGEARARLAGRHPAEVADLLERLPPGLRRLAWSLIDEDRRGAVLVELGEDARESLLRDMDSDALADAAERLETDDAADLVQSLLPRLREAVLRRLSPRRRRALRSVLDRPEDQAGGLMDPDVVAVPAHATVGQVQKRLRARGRLPENTDRLYVVDARGRYLGALPLEALLTHGPDTPVERLMERLEPLPVDLPEHEVARRFRDYDLLSAPVVDAAGRLLGRVTVDDVVDVIVAESEHDALARAGLDEDEDLLGPILPSARRRWVWLGINLLTAVAAAAVVTLFEATIAQVVALAALMPIIASMGGIAGSQTLTLVIRAEATGRLGRHSLRAVLRKELLIGLLNGLAWAALVGAGAALWSDDARIGQVVAAAMLVNLLVAALAGVLVPVVLRRLDIDPALAGGVVLTTVTDVVGFFALLGIATAVLLR